MESNHPEIYDSAGSLQRLDLDKAIQNLNLPTYMEPIRNLGSNILNLSGIPNNKELLELSKNISFLGGAIPVQESYAYGERLDVYA